MKVRIVTLVIMGLAAGGLFRSAVRAQQAAPAQTPPPQQTPAQPQTPPTSSEQSERSVWDGVYTEEQAKRGEAVYGQECANCHGIELEGMDMSPPLTGPAFTANWNDLTVGDLFERIRISMPMDRPGKLTRQQNSDVIAYMLQFNKFPAGKTELEQQLPVLRQIRILATKPEAKDQPRR